ncbi:MAG: alpha-1,2-fucosyltransferase [Patescibacteria group bacterium]|jgi:hypothetical protein
MKGNVIVKIHGGLGNQLFQYALGRCIQLTQNVPVAFDVSWYTKTSNEIKRKYELDNFQTQVTPANPDAVKVLERFQRKPGLIGYVKSLFTADTKRYAQDFGFAFNPSILQLQPPAYLDGYWQSEKYFSAIADTIRKELTLRNSATGKNAEALRAIQNVPTISIHVRRGDYVASKQTNAFHGTASVEYYQTAIRKLQKIEPNATIYVFSDDQAWVKANLSFELSTVFVDWNSSDQAHEDLRLMAACRHNVIANSTFSWWGAWLGTHPEKHVIAPKRWFANRNIDTRDIIPDHWEKL